MARPDRDPLHERAHALGLHGLGSRAQALFLVNRRELDGSEPREHAMIFQVEYQLVCPSGFLPRPDLSGEGSDDFDDRIGDPAYF